VLDSSGAPTKDADGAAVREADPAWFQPRPSQTGYDASASSFLNQGPNQRDLADTLKGYLDAYLTLERPANPGLTARDVPIDAVTNSASGIDPHISKANARIQARTVAATRNVSVRRVMQLVDDHVAGRGLGVFGQPGVNVLELNLALDQEFPQR
jgi:K+-transporting ATPase ATPase C chain